MSAKKKTDTELKTTTQKNSKTLGNFGKLDLKRQKFVAYYTAIGTETEGNVYRSLVAAGYSKTTANNAGYKIRYDPAVNAEIERIRNEIIMPRLNQIINKGIELMESAITADPKDFYSVEEYTDDNGDTHQYNKPKLLTDLTDNQRMIINGMDYKGSKGIADFDKITKQDALKTAMQIKKELELKIERDKERNKNDNSETEIIIEQLRDTVATKVKVIQTKNKQSEFASGYKDDPLEVTEEL